jgi:hypothetical protein
MYTRYEGREFLSGYRQARLASGRELLERFREVVHSSSAVEMRRISAVVACCRHVLDASIIKHMEGWNVGCEVGDTRDGSGDSWESIHGSAPEGWIETSRSLLVLLDELCVASESPSERVQNLLNKFAARYEVTKRLYAWYSGDFRQRRGRFDDPGVYASFSLTLTLYNEKWTHLKFLNTALKVDDLLCSLRASTFDGFAALATVASLRLEQRGVERLVRQKGVADGA